MFTRTTAIRAAIRTLIVLFVVLAQGCMAGQYAANECTMEGTLTRDECISTCAKAGPFGGYCAIPKYFLMNEDGKMDEYSATQAWSCFAITAQAQSFSSAMPREFAGYCSQKEVYLIQISPPTTPSEQTTASK